MLILGMLVVLIVLGAWLLNHDDATEIWGIILVSFCGVGLAVALGGLAMSRVTFPARFAEINALRSTLTEARKRDGNIENAALQLKIAETNQWIASQKYYNGTLFDIWIPDAIGAVEAVR